MRRRVTMWLARVRLLDRASFGLEQPPQQDQQWQRQPLSQTRPNVKGVMRGMMWMLGKERKRFQNLPGPKPWRGSRQRVSWKPMKMTARMKRARDCSAAPVGR